MNEGKIIATRLEKVNTDYYQKNLAIEITLTLQQYYIMCIETL